MFHKKHRYGVDTPANLNRKLRFFFRESAQNLQNVYIKCNFKNPEILMTLEKITESGAKNSLSISYIGEIDKETKDQIRMGVENFIGTENVYFDAYYKKKISWK